MAINNWLPTFFSPSNLCFCHFLPDCTNTKHIDSHSPSAFRPNFKTLPFFLPPASTIRLYLLVVSTGSRRYQQPAMKYVHRCPFMSWLGSSRRADVALMRDVGSSGKKARPVLPSASHEVKAKVSNSWHDLATSLHDCLPRPDPIFRQRSQPRREGETLRPAIDTAPPSLFLSYPLLLLSRSTVNRGRKILSAPNQTTRS